MTQPAPDERKIPIGVFMQLPDMSIDPVAVIWLGLPDKESDMLRAIAMEFLRLSDEQIEIGR